MSAAAQRQVDTVLFDLGGVMMKNGRIDDVGKRFPPEQAELAMKLFMGDYAADTDHPWHRLERGELSFDECRRLNGIAMAEHGLKPISIAPSAEKATADTADKSPKPPMEFHPDEDMIELVRKLRTAGIRTGLLTNNIREFKPLWRPLLPFDELFDDIVDSHEVGMRKPNPAIYQLALTRLSAVAGRTAFADDLPSNVHAATNLGLFGVVVDVDSAPARAEIAALAGLAAD
jgi:putative hydrolase of the HAD superfamily